VETSRNLPRRLSFVACWACDRDCGFNRYGLKQTCRAGFKFRNSFRAPALRRASHSHVLFAFDLIVFALMKIALIAYQTFKGDKNEAREQ
jgi:hypothetical protein